MPVEAYVTVEWPLTGRDTTVEAVSAALASGRGAVLAGPAGVGKTRLLHESLRRLAGGTAGGGEGVVVRRFAATEVTGRLPFGALATLLPAGAVFGRERVDLFRAVAAELAAASEGRQLVLAVDDAHLLDSAGMALLHHLVQENIVAAAVTVRVEPAGVDGSPPSGTVGVGGVIETQQATGMQWLDVAPLPRATVARLLEAVLGAPVDRDTVVLLDEFCGGDLVLLREVLVHARQLGRLVSTGRRWRLEGSPPVGGRLHLLVDQRLGALPVGVRAAAEAVAVTEPTPVPLLQRVAPIEAVIGAERAGLVRVEEQDGGPVARCAHPLYGEVLRRQVPDLRRAGLWRDMAIALLASPKSASTPDDELRVASWWLDSGAVRDATTGVDAELLLRAARRAAALVDHRLARRLALAAAEEKPSAEALRTAAEESLWLGETQRAETLLRRSLREAVDDAERTTITTSLAGTQLFGAGRIGLALDILDQGPPTPAATALRVAAMIHRGGVAAAQQVLGPYEVRDDLVEDAVLVAARTAVDISAGRPALAADRCEELRGRARDDARGPLVEHLIASSHRTALHLSGRFDEAEPLVVAAHEEATRQGADGRRAVTALELGHLRRDRGDLPGAAAALSEAAGILLRTPTGFGPSALDAALSMLATTYARLGDLDAARSTRAQAATPLLSELDTVSQQMAEAHIAAAGGDIATALRITTETVRHCRRRGSGLAEARGLLVYVQLSVAGARRGHPRLPPATLRRMDQLASVDGAGLLIGWWRDIARALATGDPQLLLRTSDTVEAAGLRLDATELAATAQRRARELGEHGIQVRAEVAWTRLRTSGIVAPTALVRAATGPMPLTPRETEVVLLAADGTSNPAIAERLGLSRRTVENHLHRAFGKLGVQDRVDLRAALAGHPHER